MFDQRVFFHWLEREGMESKEFAETRQDLRDPEQDYLDVLAEPITDEENCTLDAVRCSELQCSQCSSTSFQKSVIIPSA